MKDRYGYCSNCGDPSYHEICNECKDIEPKEELAPLFLCPECKSGYSKIKGTPCIHCHKEAHEDGKHWDNCYYCEQKRLEAEYME